MTHIKTSLNHKEELTLFQAELRHTLVKYWLDNKDKPYFNPKPFQIIDRNLTSIEKQIKRL